MRFERESLLLVEVVQHDVVTGRLRTAAERDVAVNHIARIAQHLVIPIDIRRGTVPVGFECGGIVGGRPTAVVVADSLIIEGGITV